MVDTPPGRDRYNRKVNFDQAHAARTVLKRRLDSQTLYSQRSLTDKEYTRIRA
jgi:hypothetical protein